MEHSNERFLFFDLQLQHFFVLVKVKTQEALLGGVLAFALEKFFQQSGVVLVMCIQWKNIVYSHHGCTCCVLEMLS